MRRSLLEPIPEFELAAKLLDATVDAIHLGRTELGAQLVACADFQEIMVYTKRIVGKLSKEVHRQTRRPKVLPKAERVVIRMPTEKIQEDIFERDGWRCRFCGVKVISKKARSILVKLFPNETHWGPKEFARHSALYSMAVSLDHVEPHSRGGTNELTNLVTACYCCQFGRGEWTLNESELLDPRNYVPIVDEWDGLTRLESLLVPTV
jgi:5-methylcytosine-specific restriction endonuclease McrA